MTTRMEEAQNAACALLRDTPAHTPAIRSYKGDIRTLAKKAEVGQPMPGGLIQFDVTDLAIIRQWVEKQGIDPLRGPAPAGARSRIDTAAWQTDEKTGASPLAKQYRLVAIASAGTDPVRLDGRQLGNPGGGFQVIRGDQSTTLDADWVMTVENLEAFLYLITNPGRLGPWQAGRGLLVLRSAPAFPGGVAWVRDMQQTVHFDYRHAPDMDLAGIGHCLELQPARVWLPQVETLTAAPNHKLFDNQSRYLPELRPRAKDRAPGLMPYIDWIDHRCGGVTQEQMLAHNIPMTMVDLALTRGE